MVVVLGYTVQWGLKPRLFGFGALNKPTKAKKIKKLCIAFSIHPANLYIYIYAIHHVKAVLMRLLRRHYDRPTLFSPHPVMYKLLNK